MLERRPWNEFRDAGLLWWINRQLHLFGWALVVEVDEDGKTTECYPARCDFRGFDEGAETRGFQRLTAHIRDSVGALFKTTEETTEENSNANQR